MPDQPMVSSVDTEQKVTTDSKMADSTQVTSAEKKIHNRNTQSI